METMMKNRALRITVSVLCALVLCAGVLSVSVFAPKAWADYEPPEALKTLWEINKDVIGGLYIPGTSVCYPILQHPTIDDYYLNVCMDGSEGYPGSIYTNSMEGQTFSTFNTVIYGHNMRDGSYFGGLRNYLDVEYLDSHREIHVYGVDAEHVYDVFAVVIYNDRRITDYYPDEVFAYRSEFLQSLRDDGQEGSILLDDIQVDPSADHILTLSTCMNELPNNRLLVLAVER